MAWFPSPVARSCQKRWSHATSLHHPPHSRALLATDSACSFCLNFSVIAPENGQVGEWLWRLPFQDNSICDSDFLICVMWSYCFYLVQAPALKVMLLFVSSIVPYHGCRHKCNRMSHKSMGPDRREQVELLMFACCCLVASYGTLALGTDSYKVSDRDFWCVLICWLDGVLLQFTPSSGSIHYERQGAPTPFSLTASCL